MTCEEIEDAVSASDSVLHCKNSACSSLTTATEEELEIITKTSHGYNSLPRYPTLVVKHCVVIFGFILIFVILCASVSCIPQLGAPPLPDFREPIKGFEARGTVISDRWLSHFNLVENERNEGISRIPWQCRKNTTLTFERPATEARSICNKHLTMYQGKLSTKLIFTTSRSNQDLMTAKNLKSICRLEKKIVRSFARFPELCHRSLFNKTCCPSWSVGQYVAALNRKPFCESITQRDVDKIRGLLTECSESYQSGKLKPDCWDFKKDRKATGECRDVQHKCTEFNAVYNIFHYLTDKRFLSKDSKLRYTQVLVPMDPDKDFQVEIYTSRLSSDISDGDVHLTGYELSELKFAMFNETLLKDLYLAAVAMFFIVIILWFYTRSVLITSMVGLVVVSSLIIAYFIYTIVLKMTFFPFLNILTLVFLVGIGADDAFVYMDVWNQAKRVHEERRVNEERPMHEERREGLTDRTYDLIAITADTMRHASVSMFVTSFTTASAFLASLTSEITSIRLFGLYSGIAIICMFFLMVTWFPAAVIIDETVISKWNFCCGKLCNPVYNNGKIKTAITLLKHFHKTLFDDHLPHLIIKLRYFFAVFFFLLAIGGVLVATVKPGLKLPSSQDFQMFHESHELERYSLVLKKNFHFETTDSYRFPIRLIWGVKPADNGDQFNPYNTGTLTWDHNFNVATPQGQVWMIKLLAHLKKQPFFSKQQASEKCFIEEFFGEMKRNCTEQNRPCCKESKFPYPTHVFSKCLLQMQCRRLSSIEAISHSITDGAPLFDQNGTLRVVSLNFESSVPFTWSYDPAENFWKQTEGWATREFVNAPSSANGWFISQLRFYDLQRSLSKGTFFSMGISLAIALGVMLLTTGNIFISLFAIVTIMGALGVTIGSLVLIGWKLNILESVTMSVAVGLSVDFALHYGVAYVLAVDKTDRKTRVWFSVSHMGSAITMAAFTTFITGSLIMPSKVLSYLQLGHFLMLIMSISWFYATFFFQALCSIFGPENDSGQITIKKLKATCASLKNCFTKDKSDNYQILRKRDGSIVKRKARVIYRK